MKRRVSCFIAMILVLALSTIALADGSSADQIKAQGGTNNEKWSTDKVRVSKTIAGTGIENVFDITLKVETQQNITTMYEDPDVALCIVMDISNTMMENYGNGKTKYEAAIESAEVLVDEFAAFTTGAQSKIGFVVFNTDSTRIAQMQRCDTAERANTFKNTVRTGTATIVNRYSTDSTYYDNKRYTNIEAGLRRARAMLSENNDCYNKNKFVIFLSDGLPTTYCTTANGYVGYTPKSTSGNLNTDGVFRDGIWRNRTNNGYVQYGTNYSNKGAIRAREEATRLKADGVTVYTVGAGLNKFGGSVISQVTAWNSADKVQNLSGEKLIQNQMARGYYANLSTIDNNFAALTSYSTTNINNYHWEIGNFKNGTSGSYAPLGSGNLFENWLKYGIGSKEYYDSSNTTELKQRFDEIFKALTKKVKEENAKAWVVKDPMGTNIEFIGYFNKNGTLVTGDLDPNNNNNQENTAVFGSNSINWELQKSPRTSTTSGSTTTYTYTLKYRVRLTNEVKSGFTEGTTYNTNGTTTLDYQTLVNSRPSEMKYIDFPVPAVEGYLAELTIRKSDQFGRPVQGAKFSLVHDTGKCTTCKGNGTYVPNNSNTYLSKRTLTTGTNGVITFTNIPSGHIYLLTEDNPPPADHTNPGISYTVKVAYDALTVNNNNVNSINIENPHDVGKLKVTKTVNSLLTTDANKEFSFEVKLDPYKGSALSGTFGDMTFRNGIATFVLKNGQSKTATGLPTNLGYTVTETSEDGFTTTSTGTTGTIDKTTVSVASFTNTRKTTDLTVKKIVDGNMGDPNKIFNFTVTVVNLSADYTPPVGVTKTVSGTDTIFTFGLKHNQTMTFTGLPVGAVVDVQESKDAFYTATQTTVPSTLGGTFTVAQDGSTATVEGITLVEGGGTVTITNKYDITIPTGRREDLLPYALLLTFAALSLAGAYLYRRKSSRVK